jgi:hypothetical protein
VTAETTLDRAAHVAFRRLKKVGGDPRKLATPEATTVVIYGAQAIIDNGGFRYFFENDWPGHPAYSLFSDAYRLIGAEQPAALLDRAVDLFPFPRPHLARRKRNQFMESIPEDHEMFRLGDKVCGDESVWQNLDSYVAKNLEAFWRRPTLGGRRGIKS